VPLLATAQPSTAVITSRRRSAAAAPEPCSSCTTITPARPVGMPSWRRTRAFSRFWVTTPIAGICGGLPAATPSRKVRITGGGTISPMLSTPVSFWNAMPTTLPWPNTGPPLLPALIAASTVTAKRWRCEWL
jgi:hypothetical protein